MANIYITYSQDECDHEDLIMNFLQKISSKGYFPTLGDYNAYFDSHSEIEEGLRDELLRNDPNVNLMNDINSKSLALELLLSHKSVK
jgi:hypothetical protein